MTGKRYRWDPHLQKNVLVEEAGESGQDGQQGIQGIQGPPGMDPQRGIQWSYTSTTEATLASGAVIHVDDGAGGVEAVTLASSIVWDTSKLDTGSIAANSCYALWLDDDGVSPDVVGVLADGTNSAPPEPAGVTRKSRVMIGMISTDGSSQVREFLQAGPLFWLLGASSGFQVLSGDKSTASSYVDCTGILPGGARHIILPMDAQNSGTGDRTVTLEDSSGGTIYAVNLKAVSGHRARTWAVQNLVAGPRPDQAFKHWWSLTPAGLGTDAWVRGVYLHEIAGATA